MIVNADLHIHSRFSGATSKSMTLETISKEAKKKGVHLVGTGDCLHPEWLKAIKRMEAIKEGTFELNGTRFVLTTEVEDYKRVHHLILFPSIASVEEFKSRLERFSRNIDTDGRPNARLSGEDIAQLAKDNDAKQKNEGKGKSVSIHEGDDEGI